MRKGWYRLVFMLAGLQNLLWGGLLFAFPVLLFSIYRIGSPGDVLLARCIGVIVALFGVLYLVASRDPLRYWLLVLVGLIGKLWDPVTRFGSIVQGELPRTTVLVIAVNDLIWLPLFGALLFDACKLRTRGKGTDGFEGAGPATRSG